MAFVTDEHGTTFTDFDTTKSQIELEFIEFHHPNSLSIKNPLAPSDIAGKDISDSSIRLKVEKEGDIRLVFKKDVEESNWTYKLSSTKNWSFNVGGEVSGGPEVTVSAKNDISAKNGLCAKLAAGKNKVFSSKLR